LRREDVVFLYLIEYSAATAADLAEKINRLDDSGRLPLDLALTEGQYGIARSLVEHQAWFYIEKCELGGEKLLVGKYRICKTCLRSKHSHSVISVCLKNHEVFSLILRLFSPGYDSSILTLVFRIRNLQM
jgi:hypothetical protein